MSGVAPAGDPMSRAGLWTALAVLLPALAGTIAPMSTIDLAYQVRAGDLMLAAGAVLRADPFTFTAHGQPWLNQQWGASVILAAVHGLAGWPGLVVLRALLVGATVGAIALGARRHLDARSATLLGLAGFVVAIASLGLRAQLFGVLLFAVVLAILAWRDRHPRLLGLIPLLVLVWANLHGSFVLGPAALAATLLADALGRRPATRALLAVLVVSLAATAATPFGPAVWGYALGIATSPEVTRLISEWQRTSPFTVVGAAFYGSIAAAGILLWWLRRQGKLPHWTTLAWLAALAFLGAYAERGIAWWAIGAPVALAPAVEALRGDRSPAPDPPREPAAARRINGIAAAALVVAVVALQPLLRGGEPLTGPPGLLRDAPAGLASALRSVAAADDRVVVPQRWASWFEWAAPGVPVMVDSRVEVVPPSAWTDYLAINAGGADALAVLERIAATVVVVDAASQEALEVALRGISSGWRLVHEDADGGIYVSSD